MRRSTKSRALDISRHALEETLFHSANGYLGVRASFEEGPPIGADGSPAASIRGTYVNAFYDTHEIRHPELLHGFPETGERLVNAPDAQGIALYADGQTMRLSTANCEDFERELDMDRGVAIRSFVWKADSGKRFRVRITRLCSLRRPCLFAVEYRITCLSGDSRLRLSASIEGSVENYHDDSDPRVAGEAWRPLETTLAAARAEPASPDGRARRSMRLVAQTKGTASRLVVASLLEGPAGLEVEASCSSGASRAEASMELEARGPEELIFVRRTVYADSLGFADPVAQADRELAAAAELSFEALAAEQEAELFSFWEQAAVGIECADANDEASASASDEALAYSLFQLLQSAPRDGRSSIAAKGLSGEGYEGHYFWDTEIYMAPFFIYTNPELARSLLKYRYSILEGARAHARDMGQSRGAAFPWRTIAGRECSAYYPSGSAQYHINADIAYAYWSYYEASLDVGFLAEAGAELLFETARTWIEIGHFSEGQFRIESVTGPDEYSCIVDNNFYTNAMAAFNLRKAAEAFAILSREAPSKLERITSKIGLDDGEPGLWSKAAEAMYLPYDALRDITPQDDGFLRKARWDLAATPEEDFPLLLHYHHLSIIRRQVCKQADAVLAHLLLPGCAAESTKRASFEYYEGITTHDSSLSYAAFAAMAARLGEAEKAHAYFSETLRLDLDDRHGNARDGIHAANMGGAWLALVLGFGGFRPEGEALSFDPVLPRAWSAFSFRIAYRGRSISARAERSSVDGSEGGHEGGTARARLLLELRSGRPIEVLVRGRRMLLEDRLRVD